MNNILACLGKTLRYAREIELLETVLGPDRPPREEVPENQLVVQRRQAARASMRRALGAALITLGLLTGIGLVVRRHAC